MKRLLPLILTALVACEAREHAGPAVVAPEPETPAAPVVAPAPAPAVSAPARRSPLERVVVIGASASAGFGAQVVAGRDSSVRAVSIDLATAVDASVSDTVDTAVHGLGDPFFFAQPLARGPAAVDETLAIDPALVVAVDFLFWYAYGSIGPDGDGLRREEDRLALLEIGLRQLERIETSIIVGDLPDMTPAIGLMISSAQVPKAVTLALLNERIAAWAAARPNVTIVPLAGLVESMRADGAITIGAQTWEPSETRRLLSPDRLHPTGEGLVAIGQLVLQTLTEAGWVDERDVVLDHHAVLERLRVQALEAGFEDGG